MSIGESEFTAEAGDLIFIKGGLLHGGMEVLTPSKCNMTELEKIAYAVVMSSRKLRHYFEAFKVRVTSDRGLGELFRNPEASVRIAKWAADRILAHRYTITEGQRPWHLKRHITI